MSIFKSDRNNDASEVLSGASVGTPLASHKVHSRNHLISHMLRERNVLRMLCAPHGFGRSSLAASYARDVFKDENVSWVNCEEPEFICGIDNGTFPSYFISRETFKLSQGAHQEVSLVDWDALPEAPHPTSHLIIFDDLCYLDSARAAVFSAGIDTLLMQGNEVVVISTPFNDCLRVLQPDRTFISPQDFVVEQNELTRIRDLSNEDATKVDFPPCHLGIPSLVWTTSSSAAFDCMKGFFNEGLPREFIFPAAVMLLLREGSFSDLEMLDVCFPNEIERYFERDYPMFGLDAQAGSFSTVPLRICDAAALCSAQFASWDEHDGLLGRIVDILIERDESPRAIEIVSCFSLEKDRLAWTVAHGWDLIDRGHLISLRKLLDTLDEKSFGKSKSLEALSTWVYYLSGNHYIASLCVTTIITCKEPNPGLAIIALFHYLVADADNLFDSVIPVRENEEELIAQVAAMCNMRCLSLEGGIPGEPSCGQRSADDIFGKESCAACFLLLRVLLFSKGREVPAISCFSQDANHSFLIDLLRKASSLDSTLSYRLSLHIAFICLRDNPCGEEGDRAEINVLLMRAILPALSRGVVRVSEALLVKDLESMGAFKGQSAVGNEHVVGMLAKSALLLDRCSNSMEKTLLTSRLFCGAASMSPSTSVATSVSESAVVLNPPVSSHRIEVSDVRGAIPQLYVRLFGGFEIYLDGKLVYDNSWNKRHLRLLFAQLILSKGNEVARDTILETLWPNRDALHARDSFYAVWSSLKRLPGMPSGEMPYIIRNDSSCRINRTYVQSDIFEFDDLVREIMSKRSDKTAHIMNFTKISELYRGDLLSSEYAIDFEPSRVWYRDTFVDMMINASQHAIDINDSLAASCFAREARNKAIGREDVFRAQIRAQIFSGQLTLAAKTYEECQEYFLAEFGVMPSAETIDLYNEAISPLLKRGRKPRR